jgi:AraC-like DNA-binding protein
MTFETASSRLLNWPFASASATNLPYVDGASEWRGVVSVLSAIDELSTSPSLDLLFRQAVEVARNSIGLERAALYVTDGNAKNTLLGTWGTGLRGETTDERGLSLELSDDDYSRLLGANKGETRWIHIAQSKLYNQEPGNSVVIGEGWMVVTPLVADGELVGVIYNDSALTHAPVDFGKQVRTAVFCSLLAGVIAARKKGQSTRPAPRETERGAVVRQVQRALNQNPLVSGEYLARELSISAGYLARVFKSEVGVSLVEYRNRLRIERFLRLVERGGGNLYEAALEAGFGSYAQFHRVFRRHVGTTPREYVTGSRSIPPAPMTVS